MKSISLAFLLLPLSAFALLAQPVQATSAYDLASSPEAVVDEQGVCHVTGAIWRDDAGSHFNNGAVRYERMVLRQVGTDKTYETTTDQEGIYRISIPVSGRTVFQETEIGRPGWHGSKPKVYCVRASVEVGDIIPIAASEER